MNYEELLTQIDDIKPQLSQLYGEDAVEEQLNRYKHAVRRFGQLFDMEPESDCGHARSSDVHIFRAPGRTEIGGNHTDHQHGQVLAAAIDRDILAVCQVADSDIRIYSEGFGWTVLDEAMLEAAMLEADSQEEAAKEAAGTTRPAAGTTQALVYGIVCELRKLGYETGGFHAYITSQVDGGAGLSSSAAFEMLIGKIIGDLYNDAGVPARTLALIGQKAENVYYGKPCGLMDQMAIAEGGLCHMDFHNPKEPEVQSLPVDFSRFGYGVCITNTHGSHADFTDDYAAVQKDLAAAAGVFGQGVVEGLTPDDIIAHCNDIRKAGGDRAFLRALHVASENQRVEAEAEALTRGDVKAFLKLVKRSGDSSYKLLQNVYSAQQPQHQELAVALAISEALCADEKNGAWRIHGGGFAGTIQAFVPKDQVEEYMQAMDAVFGEGSCFEIRICPKGCMKII